MIIYPYRNTFNRTQNLSKITRMQLKIIFGSDPKLTAIRFQPLLTALAFKDEKKSVCFNEDEESGESDENAELGGEEDGSYEGVRIGTRALIPYDLATYNKNAMLLINATGQVNEHILTKMADISATFVKFQFEIAQHADLTEGEINVKCQEFFNRDFFNYGCVAVVALARDGLGFDDSIIVRHWKNDGNPSLLSKPKIYIHEGQLSHRVAWGRESYRRGSFYSAPITEDYPDVLCLHIPAWPNDLTSRPMQSLCAKLEELAEFDDFVTIIKEAIRDTKPTYRSLIYVASTLERRLFLTRAQQETTRL